MTDVTLSDPGATPETQSRSLWATALIMAALLVACGGEPEVIVVTATPLPWAERQREQGRRQ